jgi:hypothetical protein
MVASDISFNVAGDQLGLSLDLSTSTAITPVRKSGLAPFYRTSITAYLEGDENTKRYSRNRQSQS